MSDSDSLRKLSKPVCQNKFFAATACSPIWCARSPLQAEAGIMESELVAESSECRCAICSKTSCNIVASPQTARESEDTPWFPHSESLVGPVHYGPLRTIFLPPCRESRRQGCGVRGRREAQLLKEVYSTTFNACF